MSEAKEEEHSTSHIIQSLAVNLAIAAVKAIAAFFTKSGSMLAEALHSFSDCGNQILLLIGVRQARKPPDATHPLGYGRAIYFWSFLVALMLFVNNYYKDETSVAVHTGSHTNIEYAAVSFKRPAIIAHEFLHLFGALDLYITPFDGKKEARRRKEFAMKEFPREIMAFPYRGMDSLEISPLTEYLIGWDRQLDEKYVKMLTGKKVRLAKY